MHLICHMHAYQELVGRVAITFERTERFKNAVVATEHAQCRLPCIDHQKQPRLTTKHGEKPIKETEKGLDGFGFDIKSFSFLASLPRANHLMYLSCGILNCKLEMILNYLGGSLLIFSNTVCVKYKVLPWSNGCWLINKPYNPDSRLFQRVKAGWK